MLSLFKKKTFDKSVRPMMVDVHSHLIPGIDDGAKTMTDSLDILQQMSDLGYQKVITTPHVMHDFYPNTSQDILKRVQVLQQRVDAVGIDLEVEAAAEYYLDEHFIKLLDQKSDLLTFGDNYLLFETSFLNEPAYMRQGIFKIISNGMKPVLAHPERYLFLQNNPEIIEDLVQRGLLLQVNTISLSGYYSKEARKLAENLIDKKMVSFLGTDCHNAKHLKAMVETIETRYFAKAMRLPLLNNFL
ncbi:MAG: capsular biosynthesis protein [Cyclobacteriaceae bacterium]|nr:capsular biosynthesis protein [Cyclobacteriaceae bacterium]